MVVGLIGIISYIVLPNLFEKKAETEYDKYYNQIQSNIECSKTKTKVTCSKVVEEVDVNTNTVTETDYTFYTRDEGVESMLTMTKI